MTTPRNRPMPGRIRHLALSLLAYALFSGLGTAYAEILYGSVVKIRDGDSVQLETDAGRRIEIRLNAIDAPERAGDGIPSQPFAHSARIHLAQLALKRRASFQHFTMDRYGRYVGVLNVHTPQGVVDAGLWQVRSGMAWVYTRYLPELPPRLRQHYRDAENAARAERRGLWHDPRPTPPWEWRQRNHHPSRPHPRAGSSAPPQAPRPDQELR